MTLKYKGTGEAVRLAKRILTTYMFRGRSTSLELQAFARVASAEHHARSARPAADYATRNWRFHGASSQTLRIPAHDYGSRRSKPDQRDSEAAQRASL